MAAPARADRPPRPGRALAGALERLRTRAGRRALPRGSRCSGSPGCRRTTRVCARSPRARLALFLLHPSTACGSASPAILRDPPRAGPDRRPGRERCSPRGGRTRATALVLRWRRRPPPPCPAAPDPCWPPSRRARRQPAAGPAAPRLSPTAARCWGCRRPQRQRSMLATAARARSRSCVTRSSPPQDDPRSKPRTSSSCARHRGLRRPLIQRPSVRRASEGSARPAVRSRPLLRQTNPSWLSSPSCSSGRRPAHRVRSARARRPRTVRRRSGSTTTTSRGSRTGPPPPASGGGSTLRTGPVSRSPRSKRERGRRARPAAGRVARWPRRAPVRRRAAARRRRERAIDLAGERRS